MPVVTEPSRIHAGGHPPYPAAGIPQQGWFPLPGSLPPTAPVPPRRRTAWAFGAAVLGLAMLLFVVGAGAFVVGGVTTVSRRPQPAGAGPGYDWQAPVVPAPTGSDVTPQQISSVAAKVDPGVVDVTTVLGDGSGEAAGTGIVLSADGLVLTNNHVVAGSTSIRVTGVGNGRTYRAAAVGYDRSEDIAVLRLSGASALTVATLGDSSTVRTGDQVVAIGNAGGAGGTPSAVGGTVTALDQSITAEDASTGSAERLTGLIEVAADVAPGDSGGPLANASGQVIGMDTAASASFRYQDSGGYGYAIPINQATAIAARIKAGQASATIHIGANAFLGIQTGVGNGFAVVGAPVLRVVAGTPAERAGLSAGDVIVSVNRRSVDSPTTLTEVLDRYHPGDRLHVGWVDSGGRSHTTTITAATGPVG